MDELITTYGLGVIIIVLIIAIPSIISFVTWCKTMWEKREAFKQKNIEEGKLMEAQAEEKEARFTRGEARMDKLEKDVSDLKKIAQQQAELIKLLIKSDELDIKSWIKTQHEKWVPKKCIDSQTLDLLEQRYAVYKSEGGNSWARKLVEEMRALPTVTVVPVIDTQEQDKDSH